MSNIQTGAERMPHDLSHLGFLAGQIGRLITISTTPVIAGDSFEMDAVGALRLSPLRRGLAIDSTVDIFTFYVPHRHVYGEQWIKFMKDGVRNGRSASLQRTFKKSFTSFSHSTRNKTRDGLIRVRNIRALNGRFNTSITHAYSIVIGSKHITLNATGGGFLTASKQFRHGATSKSRSNTASNSTKHKSPHLSGWRQIISLIT